MWIVVSWWNPSHYINIKYIFIWRSVLIIDSILIETIFRAVFSSFHLCSLEIPAQAQAQNHPFMQLKLFIFYNIKSIDVKFESCIMKHFSSQHLCVCVFNDSILQLITIKMPIVGDSSSKLRTHTWMDNNWQ